MIQIDSIDAALNKILAEHNLDLDALPSLAGVSETVNEMDDEYFGEEAHAMREVTAPALHPSLG
jgi:hypothetical protein